MNCQAMRTLGSLIACVAIVACGPPTENVDTPYPIRVQVRSSHGSALSDAKVSVGQREIGVTNEQGAISAVQKGREGSEVGVAVQCPKGYRSPELPSTVRLTKTRALDDSNSQSGAVVELVCESEFREVALVVHVDGGKGLPVRIGSDSVGTTDSNGNAQFVIQVDRNQSSVEVGIDTETRRELLPRNPSRAFNLGRNDVLVVYQERLVAQKEIPRKSPKQIAKPKPRTIPVRLD